MKKLIILITMLVVSSGVFAQEQEEVYEVGKKGPSGSLVFYDKGDYSNGWRYLEVTAKKYEITTKWSDSKDIKVGTTTTEVGSGKANTEAIVSQSEYNTSAAKSCANLEVAYKGKTFNDFYLPSIDEVRLVAGNLYERGIGGLSKGHAYLSSSEISSSVAWCQFFAYGDGGLAMCNKDNTNVARCVRHF